MQRAQHDLKVARSNFKDDFLPDAVNRAYYAAHHGARAVLLKIDVETKTHGGLISQFGKHFIKTGKVSPEMGQILNDLEEERVRADYIADPEFASEEVKILLSDAGKFVERMKNLLRKD